MKFEIFGVDFFSMKSMIFVPTTMPSEKDAIFFAVGASLMPNPTTTGRFVRDLIFFTLFWAGGEAWGGKAAPVPESRSQLV